MPARSHREIENIRAGVRTWSRLSDRLFSIRGFGVGLDGLLAWVPVVGDAYSLGAGAYLLAQGYRVRASKTTLLKMAGMIGLDALFDTVPVLGYAADTWFRAHARSARLLQEEIDRTHFVDDSEAEARAAGRVDEHHERRQAAGKTRLVFLRN
ncbi:MAG TPA: DUF4112 domain-containing protein [Caulobacteraceae bacterium]|jgi:hypothetical protein